MAGRGFLDVARSVVGGPTEFYWRAASIHAYYALVLECRDALFAWGFVLPPRDNMHTWVRLRLIFAGDASLKSIGRVLDDLVSARNTANYNLRSTAFASASLAHHAIREAAAALALLDQIEADPARRAAAIVTIRP